MEQQRYRCSRSFEASTGKPYTMYSTITQQEYDNLPVIDRNKFSRMDYDSFNPVVATVGPIIAPTRPGKRFPSMMILITCFVALLFAACGPERIQQNGKDYYIYEECLRFKQMPGLRGRTYWICDSCRYDTVEVK